MPDNTVPVATRAGSPSSCERAVGVGRLQGADRRRRDVAGVELEGSRSCRSNRQPATCSTFRTLVTPMRRPTPGLSPTVGRSLTEVAQPGGQEDRVDQVEVAVQAGKAAPGIVGGADFRFTQGSA